MKLLLDTHALIWWLCEPARLPAIVASAIGDPNNQVFVSAASAMEIATKHRLGKLPLMEGFLDLLAIGFADLGFESLAISFEDAHRAGSLTIDNRDPFDRFFIAQALAHDLVLVSNEQGFDVTGVKRLWQ